MEASHKKEASRLNDNRTLEVPLVPVTTGKFLLGSPVAIGNKLAWKGVGEEAAWAGLRWKTAQP